MKSIFLVVLAVTLTFSAFSQIGINTSGNVGIGAITNPQSRLELEDQQWFMLNAHSGSTGLLFHEAAGKTGNSIQYGGRIAYNEYDDALVLGSYENWTPINALYINRQGGGIGIGNNLWGTTWKLKVFGRAITTESFWETSDIRFKENIANLKDEPNLLKQLRGVSYNKKQSTGLNGGNATDSSISQSMSQTLADNSSQQKTDSVKMHIPVLPKREYGFIAQEVRDVFPDLVIEDEQGYLAVNYTGVIPLLVEAYKSLQLKVEELENKLENCCQESKLKSASILTGESEKLTTDNVLFQNVPNPFAVTTTIRFSLSKSINTAVINIYNMNGTQLKSIQLHQRGDGSVTINGGEFSAGIYLFALIADGQVIDTKRMVLTD
jgi:hypothetical protein